MVGTYQLVFQLPGVSQLDFEEMIGLEEELTSAIGDLGQVDGHDMGHGEMNIFVHTESPIRLFDLPSRSFRTRQGVSPVR